MTLIDTIRCDGCGKTTPKEEKGWIQVDLSEDHAIDVVIKEGEFFQLAIDHLDFCSQWCFCAWLRREYDEKVKP